MFHVSRRPLTLALLTALLAALALASAQARAPQTGQDKDKEEPPFHEYKGVHLGMSIEEARKALEHMLLEEMRIDQAARQKIESQRRIIPEGSQEWDILYRKYYNEEVKKLGI